MAVGDARVNLAEWGSGAPVVLLHGLVGSRAYLRPFAEGLAARYRVLAVDLPGHGGSGPLGDTTIEAIAHVLAEACAHVGVERPVVVGHSFGAPVAVAWAAQRPVAGVAACSPVGMAPLALRRARFVLPLARPLAATERWWGAVAVTRRPPRRAVFGWFVGMAALDGLDPALARTMLRAAAASAPAVRPALAALERLDLPGLCAAVDAPALVLWGERDAGGWESGPPLAVALHAAEVVLPGVGHMPMLEAPYAFGVAMREFLSATVRE